jgi:hypothetical protein
MAICSNRRLPMVRRAGRRGGAATYRTFLSSSAALLAYETLLSLRLIIITRHTYYEVSITMAADSTN